MRANEQALCTYAAPEHARTIWRTHAACIQSLGSAAQAVMEKVRADKLREVKDGHDGTWVAHPALIPIAKEVRATTND